MKYLLTTPISEAGQTDERDRLATQLAEAGLLDEDGADVEALASQAADLTLEGQMRWGEELSTMLASELKELSESSLSTLPLFRRGDGDRFPDRGYYEIESADVEPLHANSANVWAWTLSLTKRGTRSSHFRTVEVNPRQADHEFGNDTDAIVGIPADARKVRWMDPTDKTVAKAESTGTVEGANGEMARYDLDDGEDAVDADPPALLYDVAYEPDARAGVRAYDTRGNGEKFAGENGTGPRWWQIIHTTDHDIDDPIVLSNGVLRVRLDEDAGTIVVEEWDPDVEGDVSDDGLYGEQYGSDYGGRHPPGAWLPIDDVADAVDATDWILVDVDLTRIGLVDVRAQLEFERPDDGLFDLDVSLQRGRESLLVEIPGGEDGPIPDDLEDIFEPIAMESVVDPQPAKSLTRRREVRK